MKWIVLIVVAVCFHSLNAQTLTLKDNCEISGTFFEKNNHVLHIESAQDLSPTELLEAFHSGKFELTEKKGVNFGYTDKYHYLALEVENKSSSNQTIYWIIKNSAINELQYYRFCDDSLFVSNAFGDHYPFNARPEHFFLFSIPVETTPNSKTIYFLKLDKRNENLFIAYNILTPQAYNDFVYRIYGMFGIFGGIILAMIIINLLSFLTFRDSIHLWYILYAISNLFVILSFEGLDFQLFYPNHPFFSNVSRYFATAFQLSMVTIVFRRFLGFRFFDWSSLTQKALTITLFLHFASLPIGWLIFSNTLELEHFKSTYLRIFTSTNLIAMTCIIIGSIQSYRSGKSHALFVIAAIAIVFIGGLEYSLYVNGILESNLLAPTVIPNNLAYGIMVETVIVSIGIVYRYHQIKSEHTNLQTQIQRQQTQLSTAAIRYRTEERNRIANNIHDEIASRLFGARLFLESIKNKFQDLSISQEVNKACKAIEEAEVKTRLVIVDLQDTGNISVYDFVSNLLLTVQELSHQADFPIYINKMSIPDHASMAEKSALHSSLIVRELLTNTQKHAFPKSQAVTISSTSESIIILIEETGLDKSPLPFTPGTGIRSIYSRLSEIKGEITFSFSEGLNTEIRIPITHIPINNP